VRRVLGVLAVIVLLIVVVAWVVPPLVGRPIARWMERTANGELRGYRVAIARAEPAPLRLGVRVHDVALEDAEGREPPLLRVPVVDVRVRVRDLRVLLGTVVRAPSVEMDAARLRRAADAGLVAQLRAIARRAVAQLARYRAAIGEVRIEDATLAWLAPGRDVAVTDVGLELTSDTSRDVGGVDDRFALRLGARMPPSGWMAAAGRVAPLARAPAAVLRLAAGDVPLPAFTAVARAAGLDVRRGVLSAAARLRVGERRLSLRLAEATLRDADVDWRHTEETWTAEGARLARAAAIGRALASSRDVDVRAGRLAVERSTLGVAAPASRPPYRLFVTARQGEVKGIASRGAAPMRVALDGEVMGSGWLEVEGRLAAGDGGGPDVGLRLIVRELEMPTLNPVLQAHGAPSLAAGRFSVVLDGRVREGEIGGYVKPFLQRVEVEPKPDAGLARRLAEGVVEGVTGLLENERDEVATRTTLSGTLEDPDASVWEALVGLVRNAFVEAIVPAFERATRG
jgi:hypothetical protein